MKIILSLLLFVFAAFAVANINSENIDTKSVYCAHLISVDHNMSMDEHTHAECTQSSSAISGIVNSSKVSTPLVILIPSMIDTAYVSITSTVTLPPPTI
jgi:hypothetical protein